jgi:hypothetical protein
MIFPPSDSDNVQKEVDAGLETREPRKPLLPSVSSALVLGTFLGVGEAFVLTFLSGPVLTVMGVSVVSVPASLRDSCVLYMQHVYFECT